MFISVCHLSSKDLQPPPLGSQSLPSQPVLIHLSPLHLLVLSSQSSPLQPVFLHLDPTQIPSVQPAPGAVSAGVTYDE